MLEKYKDKNFECLFEIYKGTKESENSKNHFILAFKILIKTEKKFPFLETKNGEYILFNWILLFF